MPNNVEHPEHYNHGGIECIDAIRAATAGISGEAGFYVGNIIKYVWRYSFKNGIEDLKKAKYYLDMLINSISEDK